MNIILAIVVGGLVVGLLWTISYFNEEIHELKMKRDIYTGRPEHPSYATVQARKERDAYRREAEEWRIKYDQLKEHCANVMSPDEMKIVYDLEEEDG